MTEAYELRKLYDQLSRDKWRDENNFSEDVAIVNELLFNTYATDTDREAQMLHWLQKNQPCMFGRIAASKEYLQFCFIKDSDIQRKSDQQIAKIIQDCLRDWKRRSVRPTPGFSTPAHGFVLAVCSSRVANAAPNAALLAFATKLRELWGCKAGETELGDVHWETLYIQRPLPGGITNITGTMTHHARVTDNIVRAGINYKFN